MAGFFAGALLVLATAGFARPNASGMSLALITTVVMGVVALITLLVLGQ